MRLAWRVLRAEGPVAVRDRLFDRISGWRRARSFRPATACDELPEVTVLNVLPTAPRPDWGGVQSQLLRRLVAEARLRPLALLVPDGDGYRLEIDDRGRRWHLPIAATGIAQAARAACARLGARIVHAEQSVGLPLAELADLAEGGLGLVLSVHDFGLFCRRPHLMERPQMSFCRYSRDAQRCHACLSHDFEVGPGAQDAWRAEAQRLLDLARAVIYPSDFLRAAYGELFETDDDRQHVVAPPVVATPTEPPALRTGDAQHVAFVGSVQAHKGGRVLVDLIEAVHRRGRRDLRWSVYGGGEPDLLRRLRALPGVRVRGYYRVGSLPKLLRRDGVDLALLLSIWPETYALTLDECRLAGVPVVAYDHGAPAQRIRAWAAGRLVDPGVSVEQLADAVLAGWHGSGVSAADVQIADAETAAGSCAEVYRQVERMVRG